MADRLTGVGHRNIVDLIGVQPHLPQSAVQNGRSKPLLQLERHHNDRDQERTLAASYNQLQHDGQRRIMSIILREFGLHTKPYLLRIASSHLSGHMISQ